MSLSSVENLGFRDGAFPLVIALGVLPWLGNPRAALNEIARTLSPGGYVIATIDNAARLDIHLDPVRNPTLQRLMQFTMSAPPNVAQARQTKIAEFRAMLDDLGLTAIRGLSIGFGPLTLWQHNVLPDTLARMLDRRLQSLADARTPGLRSWGAQYLVMARKRGR
jgi:ubiquinone/menaquinone biosynthesis C-methylase UbiE